jgi:hypothetical protein
MVATQEEGDTGAETCPNMYMNLTEHVSPEILEELDSYLHSHLTFSATNDKVYLEDGEIGLFAAMGYKHGDSIDLTDRDTSSWCADVFTAYSGADDFKVCRGHRGDPKTWRSNSNAQLLPGVISFVRKLPFFDQVGKISIICNAAGSKGVEHADIEFPDLVSEFIWVRPPTSNKAFYVKHPTTNKKHLVQGCLAWFDDHLVHNIEPSDDDFQLSIRIDGRFTCEYREMLASDGFFANEPLRDVFLKQQDGPSFLNEENDPPVYSSDEEDEEEEDEEE